MASQQALEAIRTFGGLGTIPETSQAANQSIGVESWEDWVRLVAGFDKLADWHKRVWSWAWSIAVGKPTRPMIIVAPRGSGKSATAESITCMLGARNTRKYILYVRATQEQANASVANIAAILESGAISRYYPAMGERKVGKFGQAKGWNRSMVRTASGFTVVGFGLDSALRGTKVEDYRPSLIILDDLDEITDSPRVTAKKIEIITKSILPTGAPEMTVLAIQNLILEDGIFAKLSNKSADFLMNAEILGPYPAVEGLEYILTDEGPRITSGTAIWEGQSLAVCEKQMTDWGLSAFLAEAQHSVGEVAGGMFDHLDYVRVEPDDLPPLRYTCCWLDPAVTSGKSSHCQAIQIDGVGTDDKGKERIYRLYSWEGIKAPNAVIEQALRVACQYKCSVVGIETNQGGDLWKTTYDNVAGDLLDKEEIPYKPRFASARAGSDTGGKEERAQRMRSDYERGLFVHVFGTHTTLERALKRFPKLAPDDLTDASYWSWKDAKTKIKSKNKMGVKLPKEAFFGQRDQGGSRGNIVRSMRSALRRRVLA